MYSVLVYSLICDIRNKSINNVNKICKKHFRNFKDIKIKRYAEKREREKIYLETQKIKLQSKTLLKESQYTCPK